MNKEMVGLFVVRLFEVLVLIVTVYFMVEFYREENLFWALVFGVFVVWDIYCMWPWPFGKSDRGKEVRGVLWIANRIKLLLSEGGERNESKGKGMGRDAHEISFVLNDRRVIEGGETVKESVVEVRFVIEREFFNRFLDGRDRSEGMKDLADHTESFFFLMIMMIMGVTFCILISDCNRFFLFIGAEIVSKMICRRGGVLEGEF